MKIYFGGIDRPSMIDDLVAAGASHIMGSFAYPFSKNVWNKIREAGLRVMMDSGAFTRWQQGVPIDLAEYCQYIKKHKDLIEEYIVLDDPGAEDPVAATAANLTEMKRHGLDSLPVFHIGSDWAELDRLAGQYDRICLGGCVKRTTGQIKDFLTEIFRRYPPGSGKEFHSLGITRWSILSIYPLASADSTSWITRWHEKAKIRASQDRRTEQVYRARRLLDIGARGGAWQINLFGE